MNATDRRRVIDEVYDGVRCATCEEPFDIRAGEIGVAVPGTAERVHDLDGAMCRDRLGATTHTPEGGTDDQHT